MKKRRSYKNYAEEKFCQFIEEKGYQPIKRGWPDFFCFDYKTEKVILVEVKPRQSRPLKKEQVLVTKYLSSKGLNVFRWDPESKKLQPINQNPVTSRQRPKRQLH